MTEPNKPLEQMTAQERLDLGVECLDAGRLNDAVHILATVSAGENPGAYSWAQYFLGDVYKAGDVARFLVAQTQAQRAFPFVGRVFGTHHHRARHRVLPAHMALRPAQEKDKKIVGEYIDFEEIE